jgi:hypothetical protein
MAVMSKMIATRPRKKIAAKKSATVMFLALTRATMPEPTVANAAPIVAGVAFGFGDCGFKITPCAFRGNFVEHLLHWVGGTIRNCLAHKGG